MTGWNLKGFRLSHLWCWLVAQMLLFPKTCASFPCPCPCAGGSGGGDGGGGPFPPPGFALVLPGADRHAPGRNPSAPPRGGFEASARTPSALWD